MTELKTLKDIPTISILSEKDFKKYGKDFKKYEGEVSVYHLKAEAVKWVNEFREQERIKIANEDFVGAAFPGGCEVFLRNFFNLTSEDLK